MLITQDAEGRLVVTASPPGTRSSHARPPTAVTQGGPALPLWGRGWEKGVWKMVTSHDPFSEFKTFSLLVSVFQNVLLFPCLLIFFFGL